MNTNHAFEKPAFSRKKIEFLGAPESMVFRAMTECALAREEPGYSTLLCLFSRSATLRIFHLTPADLQLPALLLHYINRVIFSVRVE